MAIGEVSGYSDSMFMVHTSLRSAGVLVTALRAPVLAGPALSPTDEEESIGSRDFGDPLSFWDGDSTPGSSGEKPCTPWSFAGPTARLLDPGVASGFTRCATFEDMGFRLATTSPAILRLGTKQVRTFFFNGALREDPGLLTQSGLPARGWPTWVLSAAADPAQFGIEDPWTTVDPAIIQNRVSKFTIDPSSGGPYTSDTDQSAWWRATHTPNTPVTDLYFCGDFISFLDSTTGSSFPLFAPIMDNSDNADGETCTFTKVVPIFEDTTTGFRAGWRSTVIPCSNASVVYKCDSVIALRLDGETIYLMFAVQCDGRGEGQNGADAVDGAACNLCEPMNSEELQDPAACRTNGTPATNYVFFICTSPDFQAGVAGPFNLLQSPPTGAGQWIGVPQTLLSPDGELLFFYFHPQPAPVDHPQYGLNVASVRAIRQGLRAILRARPRRSTVVGLPPLDETEAQLGSLVAQHFYKVGGLQLCQETSPPVDIGDVVDEHFIFCGRRLHLFVTLVSQDGDGEPWLRSFLHYSARAELDEDALLDLLEALRANPPDEALDLAEEDRRFRWALLQMERVPCPVFHVAEHLGVNQVDGEWVAINDPTVFSAPSSSPDSHILLFHSEVMGGLYTLTTTDGCEQGSCDSWPAEASIGGIAAFAERAFPEVELPVGFELVSPPWAPGVLGLESWGGVWGWRP